MIPGFLREIYLEMKSIACCWRKWQVHDKRAMLLNINGETVLQEIELDAGGGGLLGIATFQVATALVFCTRLWNLL